MRIAGIDMDKPSIARVYDFLLGGTGNLEVDRELARRLTLDNPALPRLARENRVFIGKAVTYCASRLGIRQFLDLGCGPPPPPPYKSVHATARDVQPGARCLYVDNDPVVLALVRTQQAAGEGVTVAGADLAGPASVLGTARACLDFTEPVCVILGAVLHFLPPGKARAVAREFMAPFPPGSALVISSGRYDDPAVVARLTEKYAAASPFWNHDTETVAGFFTAAGAAVTGGGIGDIATWPMVTVPARGSYLLGGTGVLQPP